jgi:hypothetical protein
MYDGSVFHCVLVDGLTFICMADAALPRLSAYQFLRDLSKVWFGIALSINMYSCSGGVDSRL